MAVLWFVGGTAFGLAAGVIAMAIFIVSSEEDRNMGAK